jgi:hypothetical protein
MTLPEQNMIGDDWHGGDVYEQAETALCIWEHVIENNGRDDRGELEKSLYNWFTQGQGIFAGRAAAINLAWLVERAYQVGNGDDEHRLDGHAFDWEIVPYIISTWAELFDSPDDITAEHADQLGATLPAVFEEKANGDHD